MISLAFFQRDSEVSWQLNVGCFKLELEPHALHTAGSHHPPLGIGPTTTCSVHSLCDYTTNPRAGMVSQYEIDKENNIKKNRELLMALGLDKPLFEPKEKPVKRGKTSKKRKEPEPSPEDNESEVVTKSQRVEAEAEPNSTPESGRRRSSRNVGKAVEYKKEILEGSPVPIAYSSGVKTSENLGRLGRSSGTRKHDPKTYGSIPGIEVGTWWETRQGCSADAIHAPWVGGISGGRQGAYSVALSGGYDGDVDLGYAFTYTGSGGRDLKGTKTAPKNLRTAPQSSDQSFEHNFNKMLLRSCETKKPVRVIRGFKSHSKYAPSEGYRYDGLYRVEKAWMEKGLNSKYLICRYAFKRLPGQPPLPLRGEDDDQDENDNETGDEENRATPEEDNEAQSKADAPVEDVKAAPAVGEPEEREPETLQGKREGGDIQMVSA
ncbi:unnamed protein product [Cyclocybe aegerita]|uniref:YDG domain-containing protein n=1 Tax=Cyclocybe aegerita TaxID=1973307 RepID=A0A8S0W1J3_CYCAE|nr:unnamed protein product [Cyclocybe aegerita]